MESGDAFGPPVQARRSTTTLAILACLALIAISGFTALGTWQVYRRTWKLDLIAKVERRVHAPPAPPPGPPLWPKISAESDAYRRIRLHGVFQNQAETLVMAVTDAGSGFWVMTPLVTDQGFTVLVNRGFVPPENADPKTRAAGALSGETTVTGLLRISEPKGGFLRRNDPAADRWFSRDVPAIAAAHRLSTVAPYFVDADAAPNPGGWPRGGLTVIAFPNSHLVYAITWYALALLSAVATTYVAREEWRMSKAGRGHQR
jgi:surfeit locus 1 family protein